MDARNASFFAFHGGLGGRSIIGRLKLMADGDILQRTNTVEQDVQHSSDKGVCGL